MEFNLHTMIYAPRWYQDAALAALFDYVRQNPLGSPLIGLPTGTGKGFVIAEFIRRIFSWAPRTRVLMTTHVKTLITQNANKLLEVWPLAPLGIYSAGLKQRDLGLPITFAGVQSIYKKAGIFGFIDILLIDEAHLLSPTSDTMYRILISVLKSINPNLIVFGLTATAYRMGQGMLTEGKDRIFTDICYDLTDLHGFNRLVAEGFLAPLYPKRTDAFLDVSKVGIDSDGEFKKGELEKAVDVDSKTRECLSELCYHGSDREHWMIFASGVHHAERIAELLRTEFNVSSAAVHSKNTDDENDKRVKAFESGEMRCVVNMNKLTTGYDFAPIDLIGHMRPTQSPGLWVQMNGRGTRPSPATGKRDCLALDFARNTVRLGPINDPIKPRGKGSGGGDAPVRICEKCGIYNPASARICFACGHEFTFAEKLLSAASTEELIRSDTPVIETFNVKKVMYTLYQKTSKNDDGIEVTKKPCMKVGYLCGMQVFYEWVFLDAPVQSFQAKKSRDWWRMRHQSEPPTPDTCAPCASATHAALSISSQLKVPKAIRVWVNRPYPEVLSVEY